MNREKLLETGYAYWQPRILHTAFELGVFQSLGRRSMTARALAGRIHADPRALEIFLNALAAMGLLTKNEAQFSNSAGTLAFCLPGKENYVGDFMKLQANGWDGWSRLAQSVRTGKPFRKPPFYENEKQAVRDFTLAMHNTAVGHARDLAKKIPLRGRKRLLDLGGGSGAFSVYFLKENPGLQATIFDLPATLSFTRKITAPYGLKKRLGFQPGDFLRQPIPGRYDAVFVSHIIHGLGEKENHLLARKIYESLDTGGEILIQDFFLNPSLERPLFPALFSLNMLLHTPNGRSYSSWEVAAWLRSAGFSKIRLLPYFFPRAIRVLRGVKA